MGRFCADPCTSVGDPTPTHGHDESAASHQASFLTHKPHRAASPQDPARFPGYVMTCDAPGVPDPRRASRQKMIPRHVLHDQRFVARRFLRTVEPTATILERLEERNHAYDR